MNYYLFESVDGTLFAVAEACLDTAYDTADLFYPEGSMFIEEITEYDADAMGVDVY